MNLNKTQQGMIARAAVMAATHIRMLSMAAEAIVLWQRLVLAIIEFGTDGVLTLGASTGFTLESIARFRLYVSETQFETYIETWAKNLAITYDAETGALALPAELMPSRRSLASRLNGKRGGRPRKDANPTPKDDPRQRTAMMPIPGGKTVSAENLSETQETYARDKLSLACTNSSEDKAKLDVSAGTIDVAFKRIGPKAFEAAGFDPAKDMVNYGIVRQWCADALQAGLSGEETERLILNVVSTVAERQRGKGKPAAHLGYFSKAVDKAIVDRDIPEPVLTAAEEQAVQQWRNDVQAWTVHVRNGKHDLPMPKIEDYKARARQAA